MGTRSSRPSTSPTAPVRDRPVALFLTAPQPPSPIDAPIYWAAHEAGYRPVVAAWSDVETDAGVTTVRRGFEALGEGRKRRIRADEAIEPELLLSRGRMQPAWRSHLEKIAGNHPEAWLAHHPILKSLGTKWETEVCLRQAEQRDGLAVPRPETFLLPKHEIGAELRDIGHSRPLIFKPAEGARGLGIRVSSPETFDEVVAEIEADPTERFVVQRLAENMATIDGKRFDIRLYALVTSFEPLAFEIYAGGMARVAARTHNAEGPIDPLGAITNCDFRARSGAPVENLSLPGLLHRLRADGHATGRFWLEVENLVEKVFRAFAAWEPLRKIQEIDRLFLMTGLDLLVLDRGSGLEPIFLESNHASPPIKHYGPSEVDEGLWVTNRRWMTTLLRLAGSSPRERYEAQRQNGTPTTEGVGREDALAEAALHSPVAPWSAAGLQPIVLPRGNGSSNGVGYPSRLVEATASASSEGLLPDGSADVLGNADGRSQLLREAEAILDGRERLELGSATSDPPRVTICVTRDNDDAVADFAFESGQGIDRIRHPLSAVLPRLGDAYSGVSTERVPGARFVELDEGLVGPSTDGRDGASPESLLDYLGRVISPRTPAEPTAVRYVEPGVGRSFLVDFLRLRGRPEIFDYSALGIGATAYSGGGFYLTGQHIDGLNSLRRASHRAKMARRLAAADCRVPAPAAVIALPGLRNIMPDGRVVPAGILVRGFRCVLRVHQLDPLAPFLNSHRHRELVSDYLSAQLGKGGGDLQVAEIDRPADAQSLRMPTEEQLDCLCRCPSHLVHRNLEPTTQRRALTSNGMETRLRVIRSYAHVPLRIARARASAELGLGGEPESLTTGAYSRWFAERLGEQLGRMRQLRFLYEYRLVRGSHMLASHSLVETNVTLMAELADLDTGIFVDDTDDEALDTLGISRHLREELRVNFDALHEEDCRRALRVGSTLAFLACEEGPRARGEAIEAFSDGYRRYSGIEPPAAPTE